MVGQILDAGQFIPRKWIDTPLHKIIELLVTYGADRNSSKILVTGKYIDS